MEIQVKLIVLIFLITENMQIIMACFIFMDLIKGLVLQILKRAMLYLMLIKVFWMKHFLTIEIRGFHI
ncbi:MAG: hypothetical protein HEEMFOPI_01907 [Holosporales bacterium]